MSNSYSVHTVASTSNCTQLHSVKTQYLQIHRATIESENAPVLLQLMRRVSRRGVSALNHTSNRKAQSIRIQYAHTESLGSIPCISVITDTARKLKRRQRRSRRTERTSMQGYLTSSMYAMIVQSFARHSRDTDRAEPEYFGPGRRGRWD